VRIEELKKNTKVQVRWIAFPLHPETPEDGQTLEELFAGRSVDIEGMKKRLRQVADDLGLPLGDRKKTFNSRLAQELAKWAESQGKGDAFHAAVFRAYFVEGKNIGRVDELIRLASSVGLSEEEARHVLESRAFKEAVVADWSRSRTLGITAVPTFVMGRQAAVGFQPYDVLEQLVKTGLGKKKG
jgi:predicted DsbA family dithiol-disulfide isomerase